MADKSLPKFKDYIGQPVNWIQPKLDGHYTKVVVNAEGIITATSKKPIDITDKLLEIEHINLELQTIPINSTILCELHCPEEDATSVPTLLNEADERLLLTVFAVPYWDGRDFSKRDLQEVMDDLVSQGFSVAHAIQVTADFVDEKGCEALNELAIKNKFEGHVLKVSHMSEWFKLKPVRDLDAVVVETFISTSDSYYGLLKAVRVVVYKPDGTEHDLGNCGIGQKAMKEEFDTEVKRQTLIGRVCEVKYDMIGAKGGMRFPRFSRWRDDEKSPEECTTEQFNWYKGKMIK
jgi:ATP-dependent DNA ligase